MLGEPERKVTDEDLSEAAKRTAILLNQLLDNVERKVPRSWIVSKSLYRRGFKAGYERGRRSMTES